ncbi:unnamed protein product [Linum trigynum]|uniref:Uncharacterized protein n=1 Tax=Linum trigynum TaxID=586398 RepID=A0AAV2CKX2_9ROSI
MAVPYTGSLLPHPPPLAFSPAKSPPSRSPPIQIWRFLSQSPFGARPSSIVSCSRNLVGATTPLQKYVYPDPDPDFAKRETQKFRSELMKKLVKEKQTFCDEVEQVVDVCAEIFSEFLHNEYGGPGTLLVEPFTDMLVALKDKKLAGAGAAMAARAALLWAQNHVDQDWQVWNSSNPPPHRH